MERVIVTVQKYGNMSAATVPVSLVEALKQGRVQPGSLLLMPGFGGGLTFGALLVRWGSRVDSARGIAGGVSAGNANGARDGERGPRKAGSEGTIGGRPCGAGVRRDASRLGLTSWWSRSPAIDRARHRARRASRRSPAACRR